MSRTIRRQGAYQENHFVVDPERISCYEMNRYAAKTAEECVQKQKVWFHADNHSGVWSAPSWFCRQRNRRISRLNAAEIRRCWVNGQWDDHLPVAFVKDAGYIWW